MHTTSHRSLMFIVIMALVLVGMFFQLSTIVKASTQTTAIVRAFFLNVRHGPSVRFSKIALLRRGEMVTILGKNKSGLWLNIKTTTGVVGWVRKTWVRLFTAKVMTRSTAHLTRSVALHNKQLRSY